VKEILRTSHAIAIFLIIPLSIGAQSKSDWIVRFNAWSCRVAGFGCEKNALRFTEHRSVPGARPRGGTLVTYNLDTHDVHIVWPDCKCWSPVRHDEGELAVATDEGIVVVPLSNPSQRRLLYMSPGVKELLGTELTANRDLLFLQSTADSSCDFEPRVLKGGVVTSTASITADLSCGADFDFLKLVRPSQLSNGRTLTTSWHGRYVIDLQSGEKVQPLFPNDHGDAPDRFDPVWVDQTSIAFVTKLRAP
jgi:hypothetical protein